MADLIYRETARRIIDSPRSKEQMLTVLRCTPSVQPEIIRCRDCKFYTPMNRETKTGICNLTLHQNFGDDWFCAGAERRDYETD